MCHACEVCGYILADLAMCGDRPSDSVKQFWELTAGDELAVAFIDDPVGIAGATMVMPNITDYPNAAGVFARLAKFSTGKMPVCFAPQAREGRVRITCPESASARWVAVIQCVGAILASVGNYKCYLDHVLALLVGIAYRVTLEGHTDEGGLARDLFREIRYPPSRGVVTSFAHNETAFTRDGDLQSMRADVFDGVM